MNSPQFYVTPGFGELLRAQLGFSQAVRLGNRIETSGQGGWDDDFVIRTDLREEIVQAFDNVERTLAEAGAGWPDVIHLNSYHVPESSESIGASHNDVMVEQMRQRMGDRYPIWTQIGVPALGAPGMRIEIRVTAIVGKAG
jgi:enamine deaminase RidA (YjgF/YER057c/UK114 family)